MLRTYCLILGVVLILCFSAKLFGNEIVPTYFPHSLGSHWVYIDQDGNEVNRKAAADKVIPAETYHAFSYEPAVEDWVHFIPHFQPTRFRADEGGVTFYSKEEVKRFIKTRLSNEMETLLRFEPPPDAELSYEITTEVPDEFLTLPLPITLNEEWDTYKLKATLDIKGNNPSEPDETIRMSFDFTIFETGTVVDTETVKTPAGIFEECLKIEYKTETEMTSLYQRDENDPGETTTTIWIAPNVGIVKCHREMEDMFLKTLPIDHLPVTNAELSLELKTYEINPTKLEAETNYFPISPGSYWIYVDQDGNELTRRSIDDVVIPEQRLNAIEHTSTIDNLEDYSIYTNASLYKVTDDGIVFHAGNEVAKGVQARLKKEMDVVEKITKRVQEENAANNVQQRNTFDTEYEVIATASEESHFLPNAIISDKEWEVAKTTAKINVKYTRNPNEQNNFNRDVHRNLWTITIIDKGKIIGIEPVNTPAGNFDECLKVEFRSETSIDSPNRYQSQNFGEPGESTTTIWFAPNVGIVKSQRQSEHIFLKALSETSENESGITEKDIALFKATDVKTLELKSYEIKTNDVDKDNKK